MKAAATNGRTARLALWLSCWWYNLVHLNGTHVLMQIADAISRLAIANSDDPNNAVIPFENICHSSSSISIHPVHDLKHQ